MKYLLKGIAILTHPIFMPFYSFLVYMPLVAKYNLNTLILASVWVAFMYISLPLVYFVFIRKIKLEWPSMDERRSIYRAYSLVNLGFAMVSIFLMKEYITFFLAATILHLLLLLFAFIELKASWHTAVWSFLLGASLMIDYNYQFSDLGYLPEIGSVTLLVSWVRWKANAHTPFQLVMGIAIGFLASTPIIFF
ncbi:MAG: hypothetical protein L7V85_02230 [Bacteroidia bacterium]|nr:hypothetical protein [Bacteroidia bacterium]